MEFIIVVALFIVFILLGMPIAYVLGISGLAYLGMKGGLLYLLMVPDKMFNGINSFVLLAVPFFMMTGEIMNKAGISNKLLKFCDLVVGRIRGGVGYVTIMASFIFAGITGSAISEVTALGSILIPTMEKSGFKRTFAAALIAASSVLGPIIPPSILAVIYSSMTGVSVGAIFAGAIIPGILIAVSLVIVVAIKSRNIPPRRTEINKSQAVNDVKDSILAVIMPLIIIGGILSGVATPTEAALLAVVYALFIAFVVYKSIKYKELKNVFVDTAKSSTILLILMGTANIFGWMLAMEQVPQQVAAIFLSITDNPLVFMFLVSLLLVFVGTFMEITAAAIILVPILAPVAGIMGIDPVHFAVVFLIANFLGVITPPVGVCLFASCSISKEPIEKVSCELIPFIIAEVSALIVITVFPQTVLFIPRLLGLV